MKLHFNQPSHTRLLPWEVNCSRPLRTEGPMYLLGGGGKGRLAGRSALGQWSAPTQPLGWTDHSDTVDCIQRCPLLPPWPTTACKHMFCACSAEPCFCFQHSLSFLFWSGGCASMGSQAFVSVRFSILSSFWQMVGSSRISSFSSFLLLHGKTDVCVPPAFKRTADLFTAARLWFSSPRSQL